MQTINDRYEFDPSTDEIGRGGFGRVFKAQDTLLRRQVVLKYAAKGDLPDKYSLVEEISRVIRFSHPNLVRYYDAIVLNNINQFGQDEEFHIGIMEYVTGGDMRKFMSTNPSKEEIEYVVRGILEGLLYLHEEGLIHRDIKPANILIQPEKGKRVAKICDFGISKVAGSEATAISNVIGTYEYMSPEQLGENFDDKIGTQADLWSLGVMLYELFTDELPFGSRKGGVTDAKIIGNIVSSKIPDKIRTIPEPYRRMVEACLIKDTKERVKSAADLIQMLDESFSPVVKAPEPIVVPPTPVAAEIVPPETIPTPVASIPEPAINPETKKKLSPMILVGGGVGALLLVLVFFFVGKGGAESKVYEETTTQEAAAVPAITQESRQTSRVDLLSQARVENFVAQYFHSQNKRDVNGLMRLYADRVTFYGKNMTANDVEKDKSNFFRTRPQVVYQLLAPMQIEGFEGQDFRKITMEVAYKVWNNQVKTNKQGNSYNVNLGESTRYLTISVINGELKITEENEKNYRNKRTSYE